MASKELSSEVMGTITREEYYRLQEEADKEYEKTKKSKINRLKGDPVTKRVR